jgi:hypothetical protein
MRGHNKYGVPEFVPCEAQQMSRSLRGTKAVIREELRRRKDDALVVVRCVGVCRGKGLSGYGPRSSFLLAALDASQYFNSKLLWP